MTQSITQENLGAWVLKCNPKTWDIETAIADGDYVIGDWSVQDNYRSRMMAAGDPVVLWVTGDGSRVTPGFWAFGEVDGPVDFELTLDSDTAEPGAEPDEDGPGWLDESAMLRARYFAPVWLPLLEAPIARATVAANAVLSGCELMRQPQMGNPSWLTRDEYAELLEVAGAVAAWERDPSDASVRKQDVAVSAADPLTKSMVEAAAVTEVTDTLERDGWVVEDVQSANVGWDLTATQGSRTRRVEVKGRGVSAIDVLLTANEYRAATEQHEWTLAIVTSALTDPKVTWVSAEEVVRTSSAFQYRFRVM